MNDPDYSRNDMGIPDRLPTKAMWEKHTPEWEGMSKEEKLAWLEAHGGEDFSVSYFDVQKAKDRFDDQEVNRLIENEKEYLANQIPL